MRGQSVTRMTIDDHILELVKKYLADVAPNSMTAAEIHNKLKEEVQVSHPIYHGITA